MKTAVRKPVASSSGIRPAAPDSPARAGRRATAKSPAARATVLLTAEATPECSAGSRTHGGRGERRHSDGEAGPEEQDGREHLHPVAARRGGPGQEGDPGADEDGARRSSGAGVRCGPTAVRSGRRRRA